MPVGELNQTIYAWRKHFGAMAPADMKRLRGLEAKNNKLKKPLAEPDLQIDVDAPAMEAMKELAAQYPRYGYRRIRIFLQRQGHRMGWYRAYRLWSQAGLQLPRRRPRRRLATGRPRPLPPTGANSVWAYDFLFDACANGQQIKCLTLSRKKRLEKP